MNDKVVITEQMYRLLADRFLSELGLKDYFSGNIDITVGDYFIKLSCAVVAYRKYGELSDISFVWYDFSIDEGTVTLDNDFSFDEFKEYVLC